MDGERRRVRGWLSSNVKLVAVSAITAIGASAAVAIATVPDNNGVIHTCYEVVHPPAGGTFPKNAPGNWRVIDPDAPAGVGAGSDCDPAGELPLNFNQAGPAGSPGASGAPGPAGGPAAGGEGCSAAVGHFKLNASLQSDVCVLKQIKIGAKSAAGGGPNGPSTQFEMERFMDGVSPKLQKAAVQGTIFQSAKIQVYAPGTTNVVKTFSLANAAISSLQIGQGQKKPTEIVTLVAVPKKGV
jgi:hypothetical protein